MNISRETGYPGRSQPSQANVGKVESLCLTKYHTMKKYGGEEV
jgi:hypothetical protein